ncbi:MAG: NAD-dependent epimerase/dehydratase family protein [Candidatus Leucobacter sulfamidivorax]|nr:NAD-dependent epimerase/dehydratase family protein [Candidatus Leucobacter sulfamidivorax]
MTTITVIGGTGYAGANIVAEAASRGHEVTSFSRNAPKEAVEGVRYLHGDVFDSVAVAEAVEGVDVVIGALSPRGELEGRILEAYRGVVALAKSPEDRLIVVGGFGSLRPAPGAPRFAELDEFPAEARPEASEMAGVLDWLASGEADVNWVNASPATIFGGFAPGERTGSYRTGGGIALESEAGPLVISGADFAIAIVDEAESGAHSREHISFAN